MVSDPVIECVVEIPKGSRNKYEYDPKLGAIKRSGRRSVPPEGLIAIRTRLTGVEVWDPAARSGACAATGRVRRAR